MGCPKTNATASDMIKIYSFFILQKPTIHGEQNSTPRAKLYCNAPLIPRWEMKSNFTSLGSKIRFEGKEIINYYCENGRKTRVELLSNEMAAVILFTIRNGESDFTVLVFFSINNIKH